MKYEHILSLVYDMPWAILPSKLAVITELIQFKAEGGMLTEEEIRARIGAAATSRVDLRVGSVAVLPLYGILQQRMNLMTETSGGTSTERFGAAFRQAKNDPGIKAIVIDVDSPGGGVSGIEELASEILKARGSKPVVAVADSLMASAAYWISSAASEIVVTPSGEVGSIGVFAAHTDISQAEAMMGMQTTLISAGKYKVEGNALEPLALEARAAIQKRVDEYYGMFVAAVAKGRGVGIGAVRNGFGEGRVVGAKEAVALGMADRIGTLDETLRRLGAPGATPLAALEQGEEIVALETAISDKEKIERRIRTAAR